MIDRFIFDSIQAQPHPTAIAFALAIVTAGVSTWTATQQAHDRAVDLQGDNSHTVCNSKSPENFVFKFYASSPEPNSKGLDLETTRYGSAQKGHSDLEERNPLLRDILLSVLSHTMN